MWLCKQIYVPTCVLHTNTHRERWGSNATEAKRGLPSMNTRKHTPLIILLSLLFSVCDYYKCWKNTSAFLFFFYLKPLCHKHTFSPVKCQWKTVAVADLAQLLVFLDKAAVTTGSKNRSAHSDSEKVAVLPLLSLYLYWHNNFPPYCTFRGF